MKTNIKYTKKQIKEAIRYWTGKLRQMNEGDLSDPGYLTGNEPVDDAGMRQTDYERLDRDMGRPSDAELEKIDADLWNDIDTAIDDACEKYGVTDGMNGNEVEAFKQHVRNCLDDVDSLVDEFDVTSYDELVNSLNGYMQKLLPDWENDSAEWRDEDGIWDDELYRDDGSYGEEY